MLCYAVLCCDNNTIVLSDQKSKVFKLSEAFTKLLLRSVQRVNANNIQSFILMLS